MRLLAVLGIAAAFSWGAMYALARYVNPSPREIVVNVPPDRFVKPQH